MKLKEKLADDYESEHPTGFSYTGAAYLAGFEAAREMAMELCPPYYITKQISELGEEEVKECPPDVK